MEVPAVIFLFILQPLLVVLQLLYAEFASMVPVSGAYTYSMLLWRINGLDYWWALIMGMPWEI
jgi:hypothetical protein